MPAIVAASRLAVVPGGTALAKVPVVGAAGPEGPAAEGPPCRAAAVSILGGEEEGEAEEEHSVSEHDALE